MGLMSFETIYCRYTTMYKDVAIYASSDKDPVLRTSRLTLGGQPGHHHRGRGQGYREGRPQQGGQRVGGDSHQR